MSDESLAEEQAQQQASHFWASYLQPGTAVQLLQAYLTLGYQPGGARAGVSKTNVGNESMAVGQFKCVVFRAALMNRRASIDMMHLLITSTSFLTSSSQNSGLHPSTTTAPQKSSFTLPRFPPRLMFHTRRPSPADVAAVGGAAPAGRRHTLHTYHTAHTPGSLQPPPRRHRDVSGHGSD